MFKLERYDCKGKLLHQTLRGTIWPIGTGSDGALITTEITDNAVYPH